MPTSLDVLRAFDEAWSRRDIDALMSFVTDDCVYSASVGPEPGKTFIGREAVRAGFRQMLEYDRESVCEGGDIFVSGDRGVAMWSLRRPATDGAAVCIRGCDIFEFRGDRICRKDAYRKTAG